MMRIFDKTFAGTILAPVLVVICWPQIAAAQAVLDSADDEWHYTVAPYLWATALDGTTAVRGNEAEVDASFSDILDVLDIAGAIRLEAQKGKWGYFADVFYASLENDETVPAGKVTVSSTQTILEAGGVYEINHNVQALFGVRGQNLDVDIDLPRVRVGDDVSWVDGFVGFRLFPVRSDKWMMFVRGDIGAGDSDSVWNAAIGGGYRFNDRWSILGAYRILSTDYEQDGFAWDIDMQGLGVAVGISF